MDGGGCKAGDVSLDLVDCVDSRVSTGRAGRLAAEAGVGLPVGVHFTSVVAESGLALLLHVPHLPSVSALDGLLLGACAGRRSIKGLSLTIRSLPSLVPNGIDYFQFFVVQALEVNRFLIGVVHRVLGDLGDGLDHGDRIL